VERKRTASSSSAQRRAPHEQRSWFLCQALFRFAFEPVNFIPKCNTLTISATGSGSDEKP
jgi:hypothetical protein